MIRLSYIFFALTILLFGCADGHDKSVSKSALADSIQPTEDPANKFPDECIFDTSAYKFTTDALLKYSPKMKYRWDTATKSVNVRLDNGDSLTLHIGGCDHFGFQASLLTSTLFSDTVELFNKTKWLAKTFFYNGFEEKIPDLISKGHIKLYDVDHDEDSKTYTFENPDTTVTNLILDGFIFKKRGSKTLIDVGAYIN